jgi:hypothetical protein
VHLHTTNNGEAVVKAKKAFELHASQVGIRIRHYHANNGLFTDGKFRKAVDEGNQTISYCASNAHFMNGKAER